MPKAQAIDGDHRQHDRSRDRLVVRKLDQLALAARLQEQALGRRQRRLEALARQLAFSRPVVAQGDHELVGPEAPIMRIWYIDMRSDTGVELGDQPGDRTAWWPLSVRPAISGRHLDRHYREAPLRLSHSVAAAIALARSTVPMRVREESASIKGPGKAPSGGSSFSRRASCCKPNSSVGSSFRWLCTAGDVDQAECGEGPACPADREH